MTFLEQILQPTVAPIIGATITAVITINTMFLKWLLSKFDKLQLAIEREAIAAAKIMDHVQSWLDKHEDSDQQRHEENLYRFEKISVALARLGSSNGTYDKDKR